MNPNIQENISLRSFNTFDIDSTAHFLVKIQKMNQLSELCHHPIWKSQEKIILGEGSNILFKHNVDALVIKNEISGIELVKENNQHAWIKAGAGENWHTFVRHTISQGYSGIENLSYIPGTMGAAPIQNIGAYGVELKDSLDSLEAFNLKTSILETFKKSDCALGYRDSIFKQTLKNQYIICSVTLQLNKHEDFHIDYGEIKKTIEYLNIKTLSTEIMSDVITHIRKNKLPDPKKTPNAGSFFKNPIISNTQFDVLKNAHPNVPHYLVANNKIKIPAAWLIEKAGWRGKKMGAVGTHPKQALVIINHNGATGEEIVHFSNKIQRDVEDMFGIALIPEVTVL